jgi:hypothetical protein
MRRAALAVVVVGLTAGCGSSYNHRYSVMQVTRAFASQGITLRPKQRLPGIVFLAYGLTNFVPLSSRFVSVTVRTRRSTPFVIYGTDRTVRHANTDRRGNVTVFSTTDETEAVETALGELH